MQTTPKSNKLIGILGGMGPSASASLYDRIIAYAQYEYHAVQDFDYPPIVLFSLPLIGFSETGFTDKAMVKKQLVDGVKKLEQAGCELIVVACNTVHYFHADMQAAVHVPVMNMLEVIAQEVAARGYTQAGLLCSSDTNQLGLYQQACTQAAITVLSPNAEQQLVLDRVIMRVMGGTQGQADIIALKEIGRSFAVAGAEALILGCTELPLAINQTHTDMPLFDSLDIVAKHAVDFSLAA